MRLSAEMIAAAEQRPNPLGERELILRGLGIPALEHLGATRNAFDTLDFSNNQLTRLDNLPKLPRLQQLLLSNNLIDTVELMKDNTPNVTAVTLSYNRIQELHVVESMGKAFPKLEFLSLVGNTVTHRQHYRLFTIQQFPKLRVLDNQKIKTAEREKSNRLAKSAAGAALASDVRSAAKKAAPTPTSGFTDEQKAQIRQLVAEAKTPADIERIESAVQRGEFPAFALKNGTGSNNSDARKRPAETGNDDADDTKTRNGKKSKRVKK